MDDERKLRAKPNRQNVVWSLVVCCLTFFHAVACGSSVSLVCTEPETSEGRGPPASSLFFGLALGTGRAGAGLSTKRLERACPHRHQRRNLPL